MARILIVEDDASFAEPLLDALEDAEHEVIRHTRGDDAYGFVRDAKEKPDLVILDWEMPGLNGIHVCRWLKKASDTVNIPIIFLTARDSEEDRQLAFEAGADAYFVKPFHLYELLDRIRPILQRSMTTAPRDD